MSVRKITFFAILFLLVAAGGVFLWWNYFKPTPIEDFDIAPLSPKSNFKVIQQGDRKVVINEKDGLTFNVPGDWVLKEDVLPNTSDISIYSPDIELGERPFMVTNGCKVTAAVAEVRTDINTFESYARAKQPNFVTNAKYERKMVGRYKALVKQFEAPQFNMYIMVFSIPTITRLYELALDTAEKDRERCVAEFEKIIPTIILKPPLF